MSQEQDELLHAQDQLGRAIDQARAGEDRQLAQQVRDLGEQVVRLLNGLQRLTQIHDPKNAAFDQPVIDLAHSLGRLYDLLGAVRVVCVEGQVYVNDIRIRLDERASTASELADELARHGAGGLTFHEPVEADGIRSLTFLLADGAVTTDPRRALAEKLAAAGLAMVSPTGFFRLRLSGEKADSPTEAGLHRALERAGAVAQDAMTQLAAGRMPNPAPLRRVVAELVDASAELDVVADEAQLPDPGATAYARHTRRVCVLAVVLGRDLGLPHANLADLGVAAMFHDAGYASRAGGEPPDFAHHPTTTLRVLLRQRGFHTAKLRRQLAAVQHHRRADQNPSLYARILRICDDFDTLTRVRPDGPLASPGEALRRMAGSVGEIYDPLLFQLFVNRMGRWPPGTVLRLVDGRVVVSVSGARDPGLWAMPLTHLLRAADGREAVGIEVVDLALEGEVADELDPRAFLTPPG